MKDWRIAIFVVGESVLDIGPDWQSGKNDLSEDEATAIRAASEHLAAFTGEKPMAQSPIDILLFCPRCHFQHVDAPQPEKDWNNPPHRSHECQFCGCIWRPSDAATNGVEKIATKGKADNWTFPCIVSDMRSQ